MKLQQYIAQFAEPLRAEAPAPLLRLLGCRNKTARGLADAIPAIEEWRFDRPSGVLSEPWEGIALRHVAAVQALYSNDYSKAYTHQNALLQLFYRWFIESSSWSLPVLYLLLHDLRDLAEQADSVTYANTGKTPALEECTRTVSKAFSLCATDRTFKGAESRRVGVYHLACLSIKCYFKVGKPNLCKNVIRAVTSDPKTPPIEDAPLGDQAGPPRHRGCLWQVTWHFYIGMLAFLNGEDKKAEEELSWALAHCPEASTRNQELILTYLIPLHLLRGSFPSPVLLSLFPRLQELYNPFIRAIKSGNVAAYDDALEWAQPRLVGMSVYLVVERVREGCLRMLFKKAWTASDKSSRIPLTTFQTALSIHHIEVDADEVECMVANMIYRGYMKGYISHERQIAVLAKTAPFPNLTSIAR